MWRRAMTWARRTVALAGLMVVACLGPPEPLPEVRLGFIGPLSGPLSDRIGQPALEAATLAVEQVNAAGGLEMGGRKARVVLRFEDDVDRSEVAVQAARRLINGDRITALVGPLLSRNALAVAAVAEALGTPMISPTASHPELTAGRRWVFRANFDDESQGRALARFARHELGAAAAATLFDAASAHNRRFAEVFRDAFEAIGGRVVAFETYATGSLDFRPGLLRIRAAAPDVLLLPNYIDDVPIQVHLARQLGITATFLGSDGWNVDIEARSAIFDGSFMTGAWHIDLDTTTSRAFVDAFTARHGHPPDATAAVTWDAFGLLFQAVEAAGGTNPEAVRRSLAQISAYQGVSGQIAFDGGNDARRDVLILRIGDGRTHLERRIAP